jgi:DNA-binding transcriptional ArsR family regulator
MSAAPRNSSVATKRREHAHVFAALGDETRLLLLARLSDGRRISISHLARGFRLSRQAITKHLHVLEGAGLVHAARHGRESLFEFRPKPIEQIKEYLDLVSRHWDQALARLKSIVESDRPR